MVSAQECEAELTWLRLVQVLAMIHLPVVLEALHEPLDADEWCRGVLQDGILGAELPHQDVRDGGVLRVLSRSCSVSWSR